MKTFMLEYLKKGQPITLKYLMNTFHISCIHFYSNKSKFSFMLFYNFNKITSLFHAEVSIYAKSKKYEHRLLAVLYVIDSFISYMSAKPTKSAYYSSVLGLENIKQKESIKIGLEEIIKYNKQINSKLSFIDKIKTKIENYRISKTLKYLGE